MNRALLASVMFVISIASGASAQNFTDPTQPNYSQERMGEFIETVRSPLDSIIKGTSVGVISADGVGQLLAREFPALNQRLRLTRAAIEAAGDGSAGLGSRTEGPELGFIRDEGDRRAALRHLGDLEYLSRILEEELKWGTTATVEDARSALDRKWRQVERLFGMYGRRPDPIRPDIAAQEPGIDRMGQDYRNFNVASASNCQAQCNSEDRCRAWTYVQPGIQGDRARCWLKHSVPPPRRDGCCISGVKDVAATLPAPASQTPREEPDRAPGLTTPMPAGVYVIREHGAGISPKYGGRATAWSGGALQIHVIKSGDAGRKSFVEWAQEWSAAQREKSRKACLSPQPRGGPSAKGPHIWLSGPHYELIAGPLGGGHAEAKERYGCERRDQWKRSVICSNWRADSRLWSEVVTPHCPPGR